MRDAAVVIRDPLGDWIPVYEDAMRRSALLWHFTVLREAASRIPPETEDAYPQIAWRGATRAIKIAVPASGLAH